MDFTSELIAFQGVLISADNIHTFSKLTSRGGNEHKIEYITSNIYKFLEQQNCIREKKLTKGNEHLMRRFALYLVLNADLNSLHNLVNTDGIDTVIWTVPTIPKCLMCEIMWSIHMETFLYEIIAFSFPVLAIEVADACINHIKYCTPNQCLSKIKILATACYRLCFRMNFFKVSVWSRCITQLFNSFQRCINYFIEPPNADRLSRLKKDDQYKYIGNSLFTMLTVLEECFKQFTTQEEFVPEISYDIYKLTHEEGSVQPDIGSLNIVHLKNRLTECLDKCNLILLDKSKELVMEVSVDIFCAWSEYEENGQNMQRTIGELCYKLRNQLLNIDGISEHQLVSMIKQISHKPEEITDVINSSDTNIIIDRINNSDDKVSWVRALVHKECLYKDISLLEQLDDNIELLDENDCYKLYKILTSSLEESNNKDFIERLSVKVFQYCNKNVKFEILDERFLNGFYDMIETTEYDNMSTEIFNKLVNTPEADVADVLILFLQSPERVYKQIYSLAIENVQQTEIMLKIINMLKRYCDHYYHNEMEPCVIKITEECFANDLSTELKQNNLVKFICGLKDKDIVSATKLLLLVIMPNLHNAILTKNVSSIKVVCKLLSEAYEMDELIKYRAPLLAMLAQVLDCVRWKINTYIADAPVTLQLILIFQNCLLDTYQNNIPEKESIWLRSKLKNVQPLNMYYYRKLWDPPGNTFVEIISGKHIHRDMDIEMLISWMVQVLPSSTQQEWYYIWDSLTVFDEATILHMFHNALRLLAMVESANRTDASWACLLHCYRNFVLIIRYKYLKQPLTDLKVTTVLSKIINIANLTKDENIDEISSTLLPLLAYISEKRNEYSIDVIEEIEKEIKSLEFLDFINKVFVNDKIET